MTGSAIPLGERESQLYRAYEVENGLACGCVCPACRKPLVAANQGEKRLPYFRHVEQDDCWQGRSEGMRRAAVQLIAQRQEILLPGYKDTVILTGRSGQVRNSAAPDQSIRRVKRLLVDPLLLYSDESSSEKKES